MDKLWALEVFLRVAEAKSFSRAAEMLDLANGTVSNCIRNLEAHLGVKLINRDTRRLTLTDEGLRLVPQVKELLGSMDRIEDSARESPGKLKGNLRVEIPISIGNLLIARALPEFSSRYPDIQVSLVQTNRPRHVIEHAIDVAIRMDAVEDADLVARPLFESPYVVTCAPALLDALPAHPAQLDPQRCIGLIQGDRWKPKPWLLARGAEHVEIQPDGPLNFNSGESVMKAARTGLGIGLTLGTLVDPCVEAGELCRAYADWDAGSRQFFAVTTRSNAQSARVQVFLDLLVEKFKPGEYAPRAAVPIRATR